MANIMKMRVVTLILNFRTALSPCLRRNDHQRGVNVDWNDSERDLVLTIIEGGG